MQKEISEQNALLFEAILTLKDRDECRAFFQRTGASSATISRVNRALQYGADGYKTVLPRLSE